MVVNSTEVSWRLIRVKPERKDPKGRKVGEPRRLEESRSASFLTPPVLFDFRASSSLPCFENRRFVIKSSSEVVLDVLEGNRVRSWDVRSFVMTKPCVCKENPEPPRGIPETSGHLCATMVLLRISSISPSAPPRVGRIFTLLAAQKDAHVSTRVFECQYVPNRNPWSIQG